MCDGEEKKDTRAEGAHAERTRTGDVGRDDLRRAGHRLHAHQRVAVAAQPPDALRIVRIEDERVVIETGRDQAVILCACECAAFVGRWMRGQGMKEIWRKKEEVRTTQSTSMKQCMAIRKVRTRQVDTDLQSENERQTDSTSALYASE